MAEDRAILAIDVGAGTQDILVYDPARAPENSVRLVLPAQTVVVGERIRRATAQGKDVYLTGSLMGGGAITRAVRAHLEAGLGVFAQPQAAKTLHDDLDLVRAMGVTIVEGPPGDGVVAVRTGDVDLGALERALAAFEVPLPSRYVAAVQDHGECLGSSQRRLRFQMWERFLAADGGGSGGRLADLLYNVPPPYLTRMRAVQGDLPGALIMDTAGSAIWGALQDDAVAAESPRGVVVVNAGNGHAMGALVREGTVWGLFEHHTGRMNPRKLADYVGQLRAGTLSNEEVYDEGGHGCCYRPDYRSEGGFAVAAVTGPNWRLADGLGYQRAVPHGDMMLAGCYGLVAAARDRWGDS